MAENNTLLTSTQLNDREAAFVGHIVAGLGISDATLLAGYAESGADSQGWRLMRKPQILAAVHAGVTRRLVEGAPIALKVVESIIRDDKAPAKVRLDASKLWLDRAGHIAPRARQADDGAGKSLHEMSIDELRETQDRLQNEILSRAKAINAPVGALSDTDDTDLMG